MSAEYEQNRDRDKLELIMSEMSSDMDMVFREENDQRQRQDTLDMQAEQWEREVTELSNDQQFTDKQVLTRVRNGTTTQWDFVYLAARLNYRG